jgi:CheY-like chemotaxis protein
MMKLKILYIDDNVDDQVILGKALEKTGFSFELESQGNGVDGMRSLSSKKFDLAFVDFRLPDSTGLQILEGIRKENIETPVIFVTGQGDERTAIEAFKGGALDYMVKSEINAQRLTSTIREYIFKAHLPKGIPSEFSSSLSKVFKDHDMILVKHGGKAELYPPLGFTLDDSLKNLEKLVDANILTKKPIRIILTCPKCPSYEYETVMKCTECGDSSLQRGESPLQFEHGQSVYHWFKCSNGHTQSTPLVSYRCSRCGVEFDIISGRMNTIYSYALTSSGLDVLKFGSTA